MSTHITCSGCGAATTWRYEGKPEEIGAGTFRYLRGSGEGGVSLTVDGQEWWLLPDGESSGRQRAHDARVILEEVLMIFPVRPEILDARVALMVGALLVLGHRNVTRHEG